MKNSRNADVHRFMLGTLDDLKKNLHCLFRNRMLVLTHMGQCEPLNREPVLIDTADAKVLPDSEAFLTGCDIQGPAYGVLCTDNAGGNLRRGFEKM